MAMVTRTTIKNMSRVNNREQFGERLIESMVAVIFQQCSFLG